MAQNPNHPANPNAPYHPSNATPNTYNTVQTPVQADRGSNMPFIVGGLVVLVAVIAFFVFGRPAANDAPVIRTETPAAVAPAAQPAAPLGQQTAPGAVAPVPGDGAVAPATPAPVN